MLGFVLKLADLFQEAFHGQGFATLKRLKRPFNATLKGLEGRLLLHPLRNSSFMTHSPPKS